MITGLNKQRLIKASPKRSILCSFKTSESKPVRSQHNTFSPCSQLWLHLMPNLECFQLGQAVSLRPVIRSLVPLSRHHWELLAYLNHPTDNHGINSPDPDPLINGSYSQWALPMQVNKLKYYLYHTTWYFVLQNEGECLAGSGFIANWETQPQQKSSTVEVMRLLKQHWLGRRNFRATH